MNPMNILWQRVLFVCPLLYITSCRGVNHSMENGITSSIGSEQGFTVNVSFESPILVHSSFDGQHAWFSSLFPISVADAVSNELLLVDMSLGGDGTACPPPGRPPQNCSMSKWSNNSGKTWNLFDDWSQHSPNAILELQNGSFVSIPYGLTVNMTTNESATGFGGTSYVTSSGKWVWVQRYYIQFSFASQGMLMPSTLVHSGNIVKLRDDTHITTLYGHGAGPYRNWTQHSAVYFVHSDDDGKSWSLRSFIPWQPAFGSHADGPAEPTTALLPDGRLLCIFRADSMAMYWCAYSTDHGHTWSAPRMLGMWSVKPQLLVLPAPQRTPSGPHRSTAQNHLNRTDEAIPFVLLLSGGRPGIFLWVSTDGGMTWDGHNIAEVHNAKLNGTGHNADWMYSAAVVNVTSPKDARANPPQTSSYTGLTVAEDGAVVLSYDRLANGWSGPPGKWGACDSLFSMRMHVIHN
eukprot:m.589619 g.589619  ORF g.589619 m.589619 type:complete len:462 (+) comp22372_c0_seq3:80-1465(+)